jgi:predicted acetyltransferase
MPAPAPPSTALGNLHDGTIVGARREDGGLLVVLVDIEYLAELLEPGSTVLGARFAESSSARLSRFAEEESDPQDLLGIEDVDFTILSASDEAAGEVLLHGSQGTVRLSADAIGFETESGVVISSETLRRASRLYWERWEAKNLASRLGLRSRLGTIADLPAMQALYAELLGVLARHNPNVDVENQLQSDWVEKPGGLFTWIIERVDHHGDAEIVGMALVCGKAYCEALGSSSDFWMYEFVVTLNARRSGVGRAGVALVLDAHEGEWCLDVLPGNLPAMEFWTSVLSHLEPKTRSRTDDEDVEFVRFEFQTSIAIDDSQPKPA